MERAIYLDCRTLIENFAQNGNPRFESFCVQWKAMAFQHLFTAQSATIELLQTTAAALHVAKRTACGQRTDGSDGEGGSVGAADEQTQLLRRIGGIYLMYALYFKQPTEEFVKVTLSLEAWRELRAFIEEKLPHIAATDEVRYVFWKLRQAHAFRFAALDYCVGLEQLVDYDAIERQTSIASMGYSCEERAALEQTNSVRLRQELHNLKATQELLPALTVLEDGYNEMKEMLVASTTDSSGLNAQSLPPTTIFRDIKLAFQNIQKILDEPQKSADLALAEESKKRRLKRRSYKVTHTESDFKNKDTGGSTESTYGPMRAMRRMSARTVFAEQLPADMLRDLQQSESEEDIDDGKEVEVLEKDSADDDVEGVNVCGEDKATVSFSSLIDIEEILPNT